MMAEETTVEGMLPADRQVTEESTIDLVAMLQPGKDDIISRTVIKYLTPKDINCLASANKKIAVTFLEQNIIEPTADGIVQSYFTSAIIKKAVDRLVDKIHKPCGKLQLAHVSPVHMVKTACCHRLVVNVEKVSQWSIHTKTAILGYMTTCVCLCTQDVQDELLQKLGAQIVLEACITNNIPMYEETIRWVEFDNNSNVGKIESTYAKIIRKRIMERKILRSNSYRALEVVCREGYIPLLDKLYKLGPELDDYNDMRFIRIIRVAAMAGQVKVLQRLRTWRFWGIQYDKIVDKLKEQMSRHQKESTPWNKVRDIVRLMTDWNLQVVAEVAARVKIKVRKHSTQTRMEWEERRREIVKDAFNPSVSKIQLHDLSDSRKISLWGEIREYYKDPVFGVDTNERYSLYMDNVISWLTGPDRKVYAQLYAWFTAMAPPEKRKNEIILARSWFPEDNCPHLTEIAATFVKRMHTFCNHCLKAGPVSRCGACRRACYCSKECQREAWALGHREECRYIGLT